MKAPAGKRQEHSSMVLLTGTTEAIGNSELNKCATEECDCLWHILYDAKSVKDLEVDINSV